MEAPDSVAVLAGSDSGDRVGGAVGERTVFSAHFPTPPDRSAGRHIYIIRDSVVRQFLSTRTDRDGSGGLHPDRPDANGHSEATDADAPVDSASDFLRGGESTERHLSVAEFHTNPGAADADLCDADPEGRVPLDGATAIHYAHAYLLRQRREAMRPKRRPRRR